MTGVCCGLYGHLSQQRFRTLQVHAGGMVSPHILSSDTDDVHQSVTPQSGEERSEPLPSEKTLWGGSAVPPKDRGNPG